MRLYGRRKIKTDVAEITAENVREVIAKAMIEHEYNSNEEDYFVASLLIIFYHLYKLVKKKLNFLKHCVFLNPF